MPHHCRHRDARRAARCGVLNAHTLLSDCRMLGSSRRLRRLRTDKKGADRSPDGTPDDHANGKDLAVRAEPDRGPSSKPQAAAESDISTAVTPERRPAIRLVPALAVIVGLWGGQVVLIPNTATAFIRPARFMSHGVRTFPSIAAIVSDRPPAAPAMESEPNCTKPETAAPMVTTAGPTYGTAKSTAATTPRCPLPEVPASESASRRRCRRSR